MKDANSKCLFFLPPSWLFNTFMSSREPWKHPPCNDFIMQIKPSKLKILSLISHREILPITY